MTVATVTITINKFIAWSGEGTGLEPTTDFTISSNNPAVVVVNRPFSTSKDKITYKWTSLLGPLFLSFSVVDKNNPATVTYRGVGLGLRPPSGEKGSALSTDTFPGFQVGGDGTLTLSNFPQTSTNDKEFDLLLMVQRNTDGYYGLIDPLLNNTGSS